MMPIMVPRALHALAVRAVLPPVFPQHYNRISLFGADGGLIKRKGLGVSEFLSTFLLPAVHRRISTFHVADCPLNIPFAPQQPLAYEPRFSQMTEE